MSYNYGMIKRAVRQGNLIDKSICWLLMKMKLSNKEISVLQVRYKYYLKLKRKYSSYLNSLIYNMNMPKNTNSLIKTDTKKVIWVFWYDGFEKAPLLVKRCIQSIYRYKNEKYQVVLITKDNIDQYATLPSFIYEKLDNREMTITHFSDILRFNLLAEKGGVWIDATVFLTRKMSDVLEEHDFFVFSNEHRNDITINFDSWFMVAKKNNPLIMLTLDLLYKYWGSETKLREYFLLHLFFTMVTEKLPNEWEKTDKISTLVPHTLSSQMFDKFNLNRWKQLIKQSGVHKLTYKFDDTNISESFLDYILRGKI